MRLRISLFTVWSAATFAAFNAFLIYLVDGWMCKIALGFLYVSAIAFAIGLEQLEKQEDGNEPKKEDLIFYIEKPNERTSDIISK